MVFSMGSLSALANKKLDEKIWDNFYIGEKFCKRGTVGWNNDCQDIAVGNIYGKDWREFKEVMIKFLKSMKNKDPKILADAINMPVIFLVGYFDDYLKFLPRLVSCKSLEYFLSGYKFVLDSFTDLRIEYRDIMFDYATDDLIMVMYNNHVGFIFQTTEGSRGQTCYIPKIQLIRY